MPKMPLPGCLIAVAGVFPGMWHVCGQFYPNTYITVPYSVIEASIAVSQILAAPAAAALLQLSGLAGLQGWQILFLAEGLVTLVVAGLLRWRLPASVMTASFLSDEDKGWLVEQLAGSHGAEAVAARSTNAAAEIELGAAAGQQQQQCKQQQHDVQPGWQDDDAVLLVGSSCNDPGRDNTWRTIDLDSRVNSSSGSSKQPSHSKAPGGDSSTLNGSSNSSNTAEPMLSSWQQVVATFRNRLILYLMLLKALKVGAWHLSLRIT
jgi:hypothetical protein